jgi:hypothetical protein
VFRELEEAKDDESFLDEECEDRWTEADKRLMGPLLGTDTVRSIGRCYGSGMFIQDPGIHLGSTVDKIPVQDPHQRI